MAAAAAFAFAIALFLTLAFIAAFSLAFTAALVLALPATLALAFTLPIRLPVGGRCCSEGGQQRDGRGRVPKGDSGGDRRVSRQEREHADARVEVGDEPVPLGLRDEVRAATPEGERPSLRAGCPLEQPVERAGGLDVGVEDNLHLPAGGHGRPRGSTMRGNASAQSHGSRLRSSAHTSDWKSHVSRAGGRRRRSSIWMSETWVEPTSTSTTEKVAP